MNQLKVMASAQSMKAYIAALIALIGATTYAEPNGYTFIEILSIIGATLLAFQAAYWVPNAKGSAAYAGIIDVAQVDGKKTYSLNLDSDPNNLDTMGEVTFKINTLNS
jgi:hypothetical protein